MTTKEEPVHVKTTVDRRIFLGAAMSDIMKQATETDGLSYCYMEGHMTSTATVRSLPCWQRVAAE
jgi:hypothetical protein